MQENPFFSNPLIYFGVPQHLDDDDEEVWDFSVPWQISFDADAPIHKNLRIGLFIQWPDVNE